MTPPTPERVLTPREAVDQVVRTLISNWPGTIIKVENSDTGSSVRLHRGGTTWMVYINSVEEES